jgi:hypothetical protein
MSDKKQVLNYDSPASLETIEKILAFLMGRPLHGATQQDIADMIPASLQTANRFVQHLLVKGEIHTAIKAQSQGRNSPAVYKYGPPIVTRFSGRQYNDLPLSFFGGVERRKKKRMKMNMNDVKTDLAGATQDASKMTDWISGQDPVVPGPYQCKLLSTLVEAEKTHMRWFDGLRWSWPLQPQHEREDGFKKPEDAHFMPDALPQNIAWRGFLEDQEPL